MQNLCSPTEGSTCECENLINELNRCVDMSCLSSVIERIIRVCRDNEGIMDHVHSLWRAGNTIVRCEILKALVNAGFSKERISNVLRISGSKLNNYLDACGINWKKLSYNYVVVKEVEGILRRRFGWSWSWACEEMWRSVGVAIHVFRKYGLEPCNFLNVPSASVRDPEWLGMFLTDQYIEVYGNKYAITLGTTNAIDAMAFPSFLRMARTPISVELKYARTYRGRAVNVEYTIYLTKWPWSSSKSEAVKIISTMRSSMLLRLISGIIFGDGGIYYTNRAEIRIFAGKKVDDEEFLRALLNAITREFGIKGFISDITSSEMALIIENNDAMRMLEIITPHLRHPLKRLRAELILARKKGRIDYDTFSELYNQTKYERGKPDPKRNGAITVLARAIPQYLVAWLVTYHGNNCELWHEAYEKCVSTELCRKLFYEESTKHEINNKCFSHKSEQ